MIKSFIKYIFQFLILVLLQVLVFNNIELWGYLNPYIYVLFLLLLPFETPRWLLLFNAFLLGLTVDIFSETPGMHTSATLLLAFLRPAVLTMYASRDGYETGSLPRVHYYGTVWFVKYTITLVFAHHFLLFMVEIFRIQDVFHILFRIILSTIFTSLIIVASQFFVFKD
ncbi:MAG: rod shape-determining protein MreD [Bacteroidales bacterium]|nr:rod shape-determining protein MreD [Bacteroidales bacterium]